MEVESIIKANVSYCGLVISDFPLPQKLLEFQNLFLEKFGLNNQMKPSEISLIKYNGDEIMGESPYIEMVRNIASNKKKEKETIFVETEKVPVYFDGEKSIEFEEEIKKLVEKEFRIAANHIKEGLTKHLTVSNCKKVRSEKCANCKQQIFGYLFKKVSNGQDENYCELCSTKVEEPMFKIY